MEWKPIREAPANTRVLVQDVNGRVKIARLARLRWHDDFDRLMDPPVLWMPLPGPGKPEPPPKPRPRKGP